MDSSSPTALITGASSGIGKALAQLLIDAGYTVYGTSRHPQSILPPVKPLHFEAASSTQIKAFIEDNRLLLTNLDVLVNNCGASLYGDLTHWDLEPIEGQLSLLLEAPAKLTRIALEGMRSRGEGTIVNVSSLAGMFPLPFMSLYSGAKAGLSAFTGSLMLTESCAKIHFIDFRPGDYRTAFNAGMQRGEQLSEQELRTWEVLERNCSGGPVPERAARDIMQAIQRKRSGVVYSGTFFQRTIAVLGRRLVSERLLRWVMRRLYSLKE